MPPSENILEVGAIIDLSQIIPGFDTLVSKTQSTATAMKSSFAAIDVPAPGALAAAGATAGTAVSGAQVETITAQIARTHDLESALKTAKAEQASLADVVRDAGSRTNVGNSILEREALSLLAVRRATDELAASKAKLNALVAETAAAQQRAAQAAAVEAELDGLLSKALDVQTAARLRAAEAAVASTRLTPPTGAFATAGIGAPLAGPVGAVGAATRAQDLSAEEAKYSAELQAAGIAEREATVAARGFTGREVEAQTALQLLTEQLKIGAAQPFWKTGGAAVPQPESTKLFAPLGGPNAGKLSETLPPTPALIAEQAAVRAAETASRELAQKSRDLGLSEEQAANLTRAFGVNEEKARAALDAWAAQLSVGSARAPLVAAPTATAVAATAGAAPDTEKALALAEQEVAAATQRATTARAALTAAESSGTATEEQIKTLATAQTIAEDELSAAIDRRNGFYQRSAILTTGVTEASKVETATVAQEAATQGTVAAALENVMATRGRTVTATNALDVATKNLESGTGSLEERQAAATAAEQEYNSARQASTAAANEAFQVIAREVSAQTSASGVKATAVERERAYQLAKRESAAATHELESVEDELAGIENLNVEQKQRLTVATENYLRTQAQEKVSLAALKSAQQESATISNDQKQALLQLAGGYQAAGKEVEAQMAALLGSNVAIADVQGAMVGLGYTEKEVAAAFATVTKEAGLEAEANNVLAASNIKVAETADAAAGASGRQGASYSKVAVEAGVLTGSLGRAEFGLMRVLAGSKALAPLIEAAFPLFAALAFVEILKGAYDSLVKLTDQIEGNTEAVQKMYAEDVKGSEAAQTHATSLAEAYVNLGEANKTIGDIAKETWSDKYTDSLKKVQAAHQGLTHDILSEVPVVGELTNAYEYLTSALNANADAANKATLAEQQRRKDHLTIVQQLIDEDKNNLAAAASGAKLTEVGQAHTEQLRTELAMLKATADEQVAKAGREAQIKEPDKPTAPQEARADERIRVNAQIATKQKELDVSTLADTIKTQEAINDAQKRLGDARVALVEQQAKERFEAGKIGLEQEIKELEDAENKKYDLDRAALQKKLSLTAEEAKVGKNVSPELSAANAEYERLATEHEARLTGITTRGISERQRADAEYARTVLEGEKRIADAQFDLREQQAKQFLETSKITSSQEISQLEVTEAKKYDIQRTALDRQKTLLESTPATGRSGGADKAAAIATVNAQIESVERTHEEAMKSIRDTARVNAEASEASYTTMLRVNENERFEAEKTALEKSRAIAATTGTQDERARRTKEIDDQIESQTIRHNAKLEELDNASAVRRAEIAKRAVSEQLDQITKSEELATSAVTKASEEQIRLVDRIASAGSITFNRKISETAEIIESEHQKEAAILRTAIAEAEVAAAATKSGEAQELANKKVIELKQQLLKLDQDIAQKQKNLADEVSEHEIQAAQRTANIISTSFQHAFGQMLTQHTTFLKQMVKFWDDMVAGWARIGLEILGKYVQTMAQILLHTILTNAGIAASDQKTTTAREATQNLFDSILNALGIKRQAKALTEEQKQTVAHQAGLQQRSTMDTADDAKKTIAQTQEVTRFSATEQQETLAHQFAVSQRQTTDALDVATSKATEVAKATSIITGEAGIAGAGGFASVMVALPFPENVAVAPEVAAAAVGATMANLGFAAAEHGAVLDRDTLVQAHAKEMFLPANISTGLQNAISTPAAFAAPAALSKSLVQASPGSGGSGGDTTIHKSMTNHIHLNIPSKAGGEIDHGAIISAVKRGIRAGSLSFK